MDMGFFLFGYGHHFVDMTTGSVAILMVTFELASKKLIVNCVNSRVTTNMAALPVVPFAKVAAATRREDANIYVCK